MDTLNDGIKAPETGYVIEVDKINEIEWAETIQKFDDASLYQTWSYGAVRWGAGNLSHVILKRDGNIVALAQARLITLPFIRRGIAYIYRGPIWQRSGSFRDKEVLSRIISALRDVYVRDHKLFLRILPNSIETTDNIMPGIFGRHCFKQEKSFKDRRTIFIDLSPPLEELEKSPHRDWRRVLRQAERLNLKVLYGTEDELFDKFQEIYKEMHARKRFKKFVEVNDFRAIQQQLPEALKLKVVVCTFDNKPSAGIVYSVIGQTGLPLLAATNGYGLETNASYLLWWKMLEWLKLNNFSHCDLGGINPQTNPGGYTFKSKLAGKHGADVNFLNQFDACDSIISLAMIRIIDCLRAAKHRAITYIYKKKQATKKQQ